MFSDRAACQFCYSAKQPDAVSGGADICGLVASFAPHLLQQRPKRPNERAYRATAPNRALERQFRINGLVYVERAFEQSPMRASSKPISWALPIPISTRLPPAKWRNDQDRRFPIPPSGRFKSPTSWCQTAARGDRPWPQSKRALLWMSYWAPTIPGLPSPQLRRRCLRQWHRG